MSSSALKEIDIARLHSSALHRLKDYFREALRGSYDSSYVEAIQEINAELKRKRADRREHSSNAKGTGHG